MALQNLKKNCQIKKSFAVQLRVIEISDKENEHILKVCGKFELKTVKVYHDLHLTCNVSILAEEIEIVAKNLHIMAESLFECTRVLNMEKNQFELILEAEKYLMFEKSMGEGVSDIYKRYSNASNKYLKSYDPKQVSKHIYLDADNLCFYGMSKFLPASWFKWIDPKNNDSNKYSSNSSKVCV